MAEEPEKQTSLLGRDVSKIPCFRNTFLYSISSGLAVGFLRFMLTSKIQHSVRLGLATYGCVTIGYWSYCRYNFAKTKFSLGQLQTAIQKQALYEGTEVEKQMKRTD